MEQEGGVQNDDSNMSTNQNLKHEQTLEPEAKNIQLRDLATNDGQIVGRG